MHRRRSSIGRNSDYRNFWIIWLKRTHSLTVHPNSAWNEVRLQRKSVAITLLDTSGLARALQPRQ
jgi:hypothetical protein